MSWFPLQKPVLTAVAYASAPDITLNFEPQEITFHNISSDPGNTILISFNGVDDHIELIFATTLETFTARTRQQKIWLKRGVFVAGVAQVAITAHSYV